MLFRNVVKYIQSNTSTNTIADNKIEMLDFVPLSGDTSITTAHTSQGSTWCPRWAARRDWRLRPHTYTDYIGRIIATLISASRHSIPTLCHTYTIILVRKNAFYSKFWNIHSHGTMRLRQVSPCAQLQVLLSVSQTHRGLKIESIHAHTTSSQSSSENLDPRGPVFRT